MNAFIVVLITGYLAITIFIAPCAGREETSSEFLIGQRAVGAEATDASISAPIGGGYLGGLAAQSFECGLGMLWYTLGNVLGWLLLIFLAPRIKAEAGRASFLTLGDYFYTRFDRGVGLLVAIVVFVAFLCILAMQFIDECRKVALLPHDGAPSLPVKNRACRVDHEGLVVTPAGNSD